MGVFDGMARMDHEQVIFCHEPTANYRCLIAIHSTVLGPAVGGTRFLRYASEQEALVDALRLSRGMTYKTAMAGLELGGGKAVILKDAEIADRKQLFRVHGRYIQRLAGRFVTAEDVGTTIQDMDVVHTVTRFVAGLSSGAGDPGPWTALGVFRAIQAAAKNRWGSDDLSARTVALQGCGRVGYQLARELHQAGARLIVSDIDEDRAARVADDFGALLVNPVGIMGVEADVLAPCALGGILNDETIPRLKVEVVAGAANNQLLEDRHGVALAARGVLYVPDYVANSGGVISGSIDLLGWDTLKARTRVLAIYDTLAALFEKAEREGITTNQAADRMAERRLRLRDPTA
jgi:leucine dehydrogenase